MGSTRLPSKVLKEVASKPMLWHMFNRLENSREIDFVVLATTTSPEDDELEQFAKDYDLPFYRGSEGDVLGRYYEAAKKFHCSAIVRLTGDCPLIDPAVTDQVITTHLNSDSDYTANIINRTYPRGLDTEVISYEVLEKAHNEAFQDYEREHVTPYIKEKPDIFRLNSVEAEGKLRRPDLRLTVDREEDLELIRKVFGELYREDDIIKTEQVIDFLDNNPEIAQINSNVNQKGLKE